MPILLVTTTGRKSGKERTVPLGYLEDGPNYVLIGSNAGQNRDPAWIINLSTNPQATIHIKGVRIPVVAERADPEEMCRLWATLINRAPIYGTYRRKTSRQIPVVILRPQS